MENKFGNLHAKEFLWMFEDNSVNKNSKNGENYIFTHLLWSHYKANFDWEKSTTKINVEKLVEELKLRSRDYPTQNLLILWYKNFRGIILKLLQG
jgi:hypothetical protein